jgi:hypothetical protein
MHLPKLLRNSERDQGNFCFWGVAQSCLVLSESVQLPLTMSAKSILALRTGEISFISSDTIIDASGGVVWVSGRRKASSSNIGGEQGSVFFRLP